MQPDWKALDRVPPGRLWPRPLGILSGDAAAAAVASGTGRRLAGGPRAFLQLAALGLAEDRHAVSVVAPVAGFEAWLARAGRRFAAVAKRLRLLSAPRPAWAGLQIERPLVMGVVNVTPDSFAGGLPDPDAALAHGLRLCKAGADIIDVGGESTRPGAEPVMPEEEMRRILPVVRRLAEAGAVVSIDTRRAAVMAAAFDAGARIVNDVSALAGDPDSLAFAVRRGAAVLLMHMRGDPRTMQREPSYDCALVEVLDYLDERIRACVAAGMPREHIAVDPGIGFGKSVAHNLELIAGLAAFQALGCPVAFGISRKSTIARLSRGEPAAERLPGSLAGALWAVGQGAQILRVHDVAETRQALAIEAAIAAAG
jgi:dihydropteroate synthase